MHPDLDLRNPKVPDDQLVVEQSIYRAVNDDGWVVPVGRGLKAAVDIHMGSEIAVFNGVHISETELAELPAGQQGYVIDMSERQSHEPHLVDCYSNTVGERPTCLASMANDPTGLYNRLEDAILTPEDANAAVAIVTRMNKTEAVLYATRFIESGVEILWNYHSRPTDEYESDSDYSTPEATNTSLTMEDAEQDHAPPVTKSADCAPDTESRRAGIRGEDRDIANRPPVTTTSVIDAEDSNPPSEATAAHRGTLAHPSAATNVIDDSGTVAPIRVANDERGATRVFNENQVTLDSAATTHVCMSPRHALLRNRCNLGKIAGLGVSGGVIEYAEDCVLVNPLMGRAAFVPNAIANIISMSKARNQGVFVSYDCGDDQFSLSTADGKLYVFGRAVSVCGPSSFYNMDITTGRPPTHTYMHVRARFTDEENSDADLALSFLHSLQYYENQLSPPSESRAMTIADSIVGCPIKPRDIERYFRIREQMIHGETYSLVNCVPSLRSGQTLQVQVMTREGYTYLVAIVMPMDYSWCTALSRSVSVSDCIDNTLTACKTHGVYVESIEIGCGNDLLAMNVRHSVDSLHMHVLQLPAMARAEHIERRIASIESTCHHITSHLDKPTLRYVTKYVPIEANSISNRMRSESSRQRPIEQFMKRPMVYTSDVGLQIGDPCVGTRLDGTPHICVYLYANPTAFTHVTYHIESDTVDDKITVAPASEDTLWATVHATMQQTEDVHLVLMTTHTDSAPPSSPAIAVDRIECELPGLLYVDDLFITSRSVSDVHAVRDAVMRVHEDVKSQDGPKIDFLGLSFDVSN